MLQVTFGVLAIVPGEANTVLLVKTTYRERKWQLPGGFVESNESPLQALDRELLEECTLRVETPELFGFYFKIYEQNFNMVFTCQPTVGTPSPADPEIAEVHFFATDKLPGSLSVRQQRIVADWASGVQGPLI